MTSSNPIPTNTLSTLESDKLKAEASKMFSTAKSSISSQIKTHTKTTSFLSKFSSERVAIYIQNPVRYEKQLRELSNYLYSVSGNYKNIIQYFANLPKYAYTVEPYIIPDKIDKEKYKKSYFKVLKEMEKMNLRHEMNKALKIAFKEDVFYGYTIENKDSFFIMHLNADLCVISSVEGGVYNFSFDFSYFDGKKEMLENFPIEFQQKYLVYQADITKRYIELDSSRTICLKVNEELTYPLIPFSSMFESVFDLDEYKKIKKQKTKMDNFLLLTQKIPQGDKNITDSFTINLDLAGQFHQLLSESVPDGISVALSPMDIQPIRMEKSKNDADTISQAQRDIFNAAGVPQDIFNSDKNSAAGINKAITVSEQIVFAVLRQIERWINRRLEKYPGQYKFHAKMLDITAFNEEAQRNALHKAATSSLPVVTEYAASLGMSPLDLYNKAVLENDILGLHELLQPLASSHTQSKDDESKTGRDKKDDGEISDATEKWRDTNTAQEDK